ncbi:TolC family protein [Salinisphaera sp. LB1]|uniref:TolC family protein n=1 Tax=Salinisphaera sp. LB1 TaxID=2183911 RepID=UPI000D708AF0|nr:TolC family protein [Salinisphaera sp. LB1]AWN14883.1 outer membrane efflux protein [Salinisphaera sp. LB1]
MNRRLIQLGLLGTLVAAPIMPALATGAQAPGGGDDSAPGPTRSLSLEQAVNDALATNVNTLIARAKEDEAAGQRVSARSAFLPHVSGQVSESRQKTNLAAQGFSFGSDVGPQAGAAAGGPSFPSTVTYNNFDARAKLRQTLFDYSAWQDYQGARLGEKVAADKLAVAREQVATQTELDYVQALSTRRAVAAAQANVKQARTLLKLARDQAHVGVATGVDVTRARARLARDQADLAQRRTERTRAEIQLARTTGLPLDAHLKLTDPLVFRPMPLGPVNTAINTALADRPEITVARMHIARGQRHLASARGQRLPTLSVEADYGASGNTPSRNDQPTYAFGASLSLPIFAGGRISGQIDSAASQLDQQRIRFHDTQRQIEQDVRTSRQTLKTLSQRVRAARANLTLAKQELSRSRDRFSRGVGDNVEVVDAQSNLADARNSRIDALAEYTRARINLAAALGRAQQFSLTQPVTP